MPERIQLRRTKGWVKPPDAVVVARPSRWGNPYKVRPNRVPLPPHGSGRYSNTGPLWVVVGTRRGHEDGSQWGAWDDKREATEFAVELFERELQAAWCDLDGQLRRRRYLSDLIGHDLACWCPLTTDEGWLYPCHARVLLTMAAQLEAEDACPDRR